MESHQPTRLFATETHEPGGVIHASDLSAKATRNVGAACELCGRKPVYKTDGQSRQLCRRCANGTPNPIRKQPLPGRNDSCACGSGKKFKRCCLNAAQPKPPAVPHEPAKIASLAAAVASITAHGTIL